MRRFAFVLPAVILLLAACGGTPAEPTPTPPVREEGAVIDLESLPTPLPASTMPATPVVTDPNASGLPFDATEREVDAALAPAQTYSGYTCIIAAQAGCSCERPIIQRVRFTFTEDGRMYYRYATANNINVSWQLSRVGPDQWSVTLPIVSSEQDFEGSLVGLLTFSENGYTFTQVVDFNAEGLGQDGSGFIRCPSIEYRLLDVEPAQPTLEP
ncbi:MAG: hypothetical protein ACFB51_02590 [Anaerolineae bacterium]